MIQGEEITISGGKLTNVQGDYHEHNTTYVNQSLTNRKIMGFFKGQ